MNWDMNAEFKRYWEGLKAQVGETLESKRPYAEAAWVSCVSQVIKHLREHGQLEAAAMVAGVTLV